MSAPFSARDAADLIDLVHDYPLAWIVTGSAGNLGSSLLPIQLECAEDGTPQRVLGHFGRNNPQLQAIAHDGRATILVLGPQAYVSPSWFRNRQQAPTWNFASAVFAVDVELRDTPDEALERLGSLVEQMERDRPGAWQMSELGERYAGLSARIVGFRARITAVRSTFKLGQDENDPTFADILHGLDTLDQTAVSHWMRRLGSDRPAEALPPALPAPTVPDPDIMQFIDAVRDEGRRLSAAAGHPRDWPSRRRIAEQARAAWNRGGPQMADTRELTAETEAGPVRLRLYDPAPGHSKPALMYMHGGGWAMFSLDTHDRVMRELASATGFTVVGVDYALAPESRYPVAMNQVIGVVRWLHQHGASEGLDPERIALGGDSAGGSLSFGAALKLRDAGEPDLIKAILSYYGGFTPECSPATLQRYGTPADMLTGEEVRAFWHNYIDDLQVRRDPCAVPVLARLQGLPPAFLGSGECDVVTEQNLHMAGALLAAGVNVVARVYPAAPHSFIEAVEVSATARQAIADGARWLKTIL